MQNLMDRRKASPSFERHQPDAPKITNYLNHLRNIRVGVSVLDVGCGDMSIRNYLKAGSHYVGIDAFPVNDEVVNMEIEDCKFDDHTFDTVICFAVLDGLRDIDKAVEQMKRVCKRNVYFLTGVDIPPDKYHTHMITRQWLDSKFADWRSGYSEQVFPKVWLIEYIRHKPIP